MSFNSPYDPANGNPNQQSFPHSPNQYQQTPPPQPNFNYSSVPAYGAGPDAVPTGRTNVLAIVSFILSFVIPIVGLVMSIVALKQAGETGDNKGLAKAGIILGAVFTVANVLIFIFVVVASMMAAQTGAMSSPTSTF